MTQVEVDTHHRECHSTTRPVDGCWQCGRDRAICNAKQRYDTWAEADTVAVGINEGRAYLDPVVRYRCRWCDRWHLTSRLNRHRRHRVRKAYRKYATRIETQRRAGITPPPVPHTRYCIGAGSFGPCFCGADEVNRRRLIAA